MKKEYYAVMYNVLDQERFCSLDPYEYDSCQEIGTLEEAKLAKDIMKTRFPESNYRVVKLLIEEIE